MWTRTGKRQAQDLGLVDETRRASAPSITAPSTVTTTAMYKRAAVR